jgi:hypothetical protein
MVQYVAVRFRRHDPRLYTYAWHGTPPAKAGDVVEVDTAAGRRTVLVAATSDQRPPFRTKPILRIVPPEPGTLFAQASGE